MERIQQLVSHPNLMRNQDFDLIRENKEKYPYTQAYHLLWLIAVHKFQSENFEKELEKSSIYFNDPSLIHQHLYQLKQNIIETGSSINIEEETAVTEKETTINIEKTEDLITDLFIETETIQKIDEAYNSDDSYIENLKKVGLDHLIPIHLRDTPPEKEQADQEQELIPKDEEVHIENTKKEEIIVKEVTVEHTEEPIFAIDNSNEIVENNETEIKDDTEENINTSRLESSDIENDTVEKEPEVENPANKNIAVTSEENLPEHADKITNSIVFNSKKTFSQWLDVSNATSSSSRKEKDEIINTFITDNPKISPVDYSRQEDKTIVEEDDDILHLMTETLAGLYVEQKKYAKAIEAYEILILKNPKKNKIFVAKINEIKNLK